MLHLPPGVEKVSVCRGRRDAWTPRRRDGECMAASDIGFHSPTCRRRLGVSASRRLRPRVATTVALCPQPFRDLLRRLAAPPAVRTLLYQDRDASIAAVSYRRRGLVPRPPAFCGGTGMQARSTRDTSTSCENQRIAPDTG